MSKRLAPDSSAFHRVAGWGQASQPNHVPTITQHPANPFADVNLRAGIFAQSAIANSQVAQPSTAPAPTAQSLLEEQRRRLAQQVQSSRAPQPDSEEHK
tara:strand:- start:337 stop:633 length:297 start_codon:yes stop_codon:yes gene_type:complete